MLCFNSVFFRCVVFATLLVEGLGRTNKREAGVEGVFQFFLFLVMFGPLNSLYHVGFHVVDFCVMCTH